MRAARLSKLIGIICSLCSTNSWVGRIDRRCRLAIPGLVILWESRFNLSKLYKILEFDLPPRN
jgi:hypothetical protein